MAFLPIYDDTPRRHLAVATYALILACIAVFLWQVSLGPRGEHNADLAYGMVPAVLFGEAELPARLQLIPPWAMLFTGMFLHGSLMHLLGNMLYLWIFGRGVEEALGAPRFLALYLVAGVVAALTQAMTDPSAEVPMIGASGAIAGALGAYVVLYPRGNVAVFVWFLIFIRVIMVPALLMLGLWFLLQLLSALSAESGEPGVAFWAHVGGFICGMLLAPFLRRRGVALLQPRRSAYFETRRSRGPWG
jgi:membrane associated rhomboid family serine protease